MPSGPHRTGAKFSEARDGREDAMAEAAMRTGMAGVTGFEPVALGFGDRCSTS